MIVAVNFLSCTQEVRNRPQNTPALSPLAFETTFQTGKEEEEIFFSNPLANFCIIHPQPKTLSDACIDSVTCNQKHQWMNPCNMYRVYTVYPKNSRPTALRLCRSTLLQSQCSCLQANVKTENPQPNLFFFTRLSLSIAQSALTHHMAYNGFTAIRRYYSATPFVCNS